MDQDNIALRLSRLSTAWTMVLQAHGGELDAQKVARKALIERYQGAIYRYLLGAVRNEHTADELFQEFALQFLRGGFRHASRDRGRFRDYVKTSLIHLVNRQRQHKLCRPVLMDLDHIQPATPAGEVADLDRAFTENWRKELLAKTWSALADFERQESQPYFTVLKYRTEHEQATSAELAKELTAMLQPAKPFTNTGIRKNLQRAREKFADLLLNEVSHSLDNPSLDELEEELIEMRLLAYCRPALDRRRNS